MSVKITKIENKNDAIQTGSLVPGVLQKIGMSGMNQQLGMDWSPCRIYRYHIHVHVYRKLVNIQLISCKLNSGPLQLDVWN